MATLLDIKNIVANQLGHDDGSTTNNMRDRLINLARSQYYGSRRWSFLFKPGTAVTMAPVSGNALLSVGTLPADRNRSFDPETVYSYSGSLAFKYQKVPFDQLQGFLPNNYVYAVDPANNLLYTNQPGITTITVDYYAKPSDAPLDGSTNATTESAPNIQAIAWLAIAQYWISSERDETNFDRFKKLYDAEFAQDVRRDTANQPVRAYRRLSRHMGYNRGSATQPASGYVSNRY